MAKISGLGWTTLSVDTSTPTLTDIKNDVTNLTIGIPRGVQDITGIDKSAFERLLLLSDGTVQLNGVFNASKSHTVFKDISTSDVVRTTSIAIASQTLSMEMLYTDYQLTRANSGEFTWQAPGVLADGTQPAWS